VFNFTDARAAARRVSELLAHPPSAAELAAAQKRLVEEHIDVSDFVVEELDRVASGRR
jgi:hypothetical protein